MITGELRSQVDRDWDAFWAGGITNPLEVIEQITCLLFIKRLDDRHREQENQANILVKAIDNPIFGPEELRWSRLKTPTGGHVRHICEKCLHRFLTFTDDNTTYSELCEHKRRTRTALRLASNLFVTSSKIN